jgi:hypothetical protein
VRRTTEPGLADVTEQEARNQQQKLSLDRNEEMTMGDGDVVTANNVGPACLMRCAMGIAH